MQTCNVAVSDRRHDTVISLNNTGNRGGHNLNGVGVPGSIVTCLPLAEVLASCSVKSVDFMKMDIEGSELRVLRRFYEDTPPSSAVRPTWLLVEVSGGPANPADRRALTDLITQNGYTAVVERANTLFRKRPTGDD